MNEIDKIVSGLNEGISKLHDIRPYDQLCIVGCPHLVHKIAKQNDVYFDREHTAEYNCFGQMFGLNIYVDDEMLDNQFAIMSEEEYKRNKALRDEQREFLARFKPSSQGKLDGIFKGEK